MHLQQVRTALLCLTFLTLMGLGGCTFIIQAPIVCPEGTMLQNGRCMGQVVGAAGQGGGGNASGGNVGAVNNGASVVGQLSSFPNGGSAEWDTSVESLLLSNYDSNKSGSIDNNAEVNAIPCDVWSAMDDATRRDDEVPVMALYGFAPDYLWAGDALGFDLDVRETAAQKMESCGLSY